MIFREAFKKDITRMHAIRTAVRENALSDPARITAADYEEFLFKRGKGWVCEVDELIVGFAIADLKENNIWALFVHPDYESEGIGRKLHDKMLHWYFLQTSHTVWLSTSPDTRAEKFYSGAGWKAAGIAANGESRFEMSAQNWKDLRDKK
jgi:GNAT superfamily N-acetyltransferase